MSSVKAPTINNNVLLNHITSVSRLKNDAALSRFLEVAPPVISKMRAGKLSFGPTLIIKTHEKTGMTIADIKAVLSGG